LHLCSPRHLTGSSVQPPPLPPPPPKKRVFCIVKLELCMRTINW
jgi:hypothetical protein